MANTLTNVIPQILAQGLVALREQSIMARLVNRDYGTDARNKGDTIDVPIPSAITTRDVTPLSTGPTNQDSAPTTVAISLNQWKEATFHLTDKQVAEAVDSIRFPMQASEAVKSLANTVDSYILGFYTGVYNHAGTAGTTPFATNLNAFRDARKRLNITLAPMADRRTVLDADAEANALMVDTFLEADKAGSTEGVVSGNIGRKLGADWFLDQNIPTHTEGTLGVTGAITSVVTDGALTTASTTVNMNRATLTGTLVTGDLVQITRDDGSIYQGAVTATVTAGSNSIVAVLTPAVGGAIASNTAVVIGKASAGADTHIENLVFHRDAFALATRPLPTVTTGGSIIQSATDPISGLSLRLEVSRQHKQTTWGFDILYGAQLVRAELACRLLG